MLLFLLFLALVLCSLYFISKLSNINAVQKKQLLALTKQNNCYRNKIKEQFAANSIIVKYTIPKFKSGIIANSCLLYIAPIESSPILCNLDKNVQITIIDSAEIDNFIWYEIIINSNNNVNNKGWIKSQDIMLYDSYALRNKV